MIQNHVACKFLAQEIRRLNSRKTYYYKSKIQKMWKYKDTIHEYSILIKILNIYKIY